MGRQALLNHFHYTRFVVSQIVARESVRRGGTRFRALDIFCANEQVLLV